MINCQAKLFGCYEQLPAKQMFKLVWRKQKRSALVCPNCFSRIKELELKELQIKQSELMKSGYYQQGAREMDIKSYLQKWIKKAKTEL